MPVLTFRTSIDAPADELFAWHARPGAFQRLTPPWAPVRLERHEGIRDGDRAVLRLGVGPLSLRWVAEHYGYEAGRQFCDRQVQGPFASWAHLHRMEPDGSGGSTLIDRIHYALPGGEVGAVLGGALVRRELQRQFAYRHRITRRDLALHRRYNPAGRRLRIAVSGASGLIGSNLCAFLTTGGHEVRRLVRRPPRDDAEVFWQPETGQIEAEKLAGLDAVVHLAGESVFAVRWDEARKRRIYDSRVRGTRLLAEALARLDDPPRVLLTASGISYYGDRGVEAVTEAAPPAEAGFLARVARDWEAAAQPAAEAGLRTVPLRIGVVLTPAGGALRLMYLPFLLGLGGYAGAPDQYLSWIALDDVLGAIYHLLWTDDVAGPVNLTAPNPATMAEYARTLGRVVRRPAVLNVPASVVRAVMGEAGEEIALQSLRVLPDRLLASGYRFAEPRLEPALRHLLGRPA
ncbi:TIGR01777 family protein [Rhodothermaceae bacterium RA]|nr:TIGR01777 family protein [Rhodothermaceae bacterium RA]